MVLLPKGLHALKQVAKEVGVDFRGAYINLAGSFDSTRNQTGSNTIGYQESEIREKFRELAGLVLIPDSVTGIEQAVNRCDQWTSVGELTDQLRRYGRSESQWAPCASGRARRPRLMWCRRPSRS
jgi:hypothetical protein